MQTDVRHLQALERIRVQEPAFVEYLEQRLTAHDSSVRKQRDDVAVRWAQGRAQEVEDLLRLIADSSNILAKAGSGASGRKSK